MPEPPWLAIALAEVGVRACPPGSSNPRITEYHSDTNIAGYDDKVSWCSSFVHWTLGRAGIQGTGSALARSWLQWGVALEHPVRGCIAVLWHEEPGSWKGHVGYCVRHDAEAIVLLGGNQRAAVCELAYPLSRVLSCRWPSGVPLG